jgi:hypothetical protein
MDRYTERRTDEQIEKQTNRWKDGWADGKRRIWTDRRTVQMCGWIGEQIFMLIDR